MSMMEVDSNSKLKNEKNSQKSKELNIKDQETEERTIYVGNVKATTKKKKLEKFFSSYGEVETIRYRGAAPESMEMTKKEAITTGKLHKHRPTLIAFIRFKEKEAKEKALAASGEVFFGLHLSVDHAILQQRKQYNSVFVGNLPWEVQDEQLWTHFSACGPIHDVRIVRSSETGACKGFGYVSFKTKDAIEAALKLTDTKIDERPIRVKRTSKKEKIKRVTKRKQLKSGVASLLKTKSKTNTMNLDFLKKDKPHANKVKDKKRNDRRKLKPVNKSANAFSGTEHTGKTNTDQVKNKKSKNRSKFELKNRRVAKILESKNQK